jgi:hypothetical protein
MGFQVMPINDPSCACELPSTFNLGKASLGMLDNLGLELLEAHRQYLPIFVDG